MPQRLIKNPTSSRKMKQSYLPSNENLLLLLGDLAVRPFPLHQDLPFKRKKNENKKKLELSHLHEQIHSVILHNGSLRE